MTDKIIVYKKIHEVIISCNTLEQISSASNMIRNFCELYDFKIWCLTLENILERKKQHIIMKTSPVVYYLIGPPGIGKSTYLENKLLIPGVDYHIASTDNLITQKGAIIGLGYNDAFKKFNFGDIEKEFILGIKLAINERKDIIVDRTNLSAKGRFKTLNLFPLDYKKVAILFDFSNREKLDAQLAKRERETGKKIHPSIVDDMIKTYKPPTKDEFNEIIIIR